MTQEKDSKDKQSGLRGRAEEVLGGKPSHTEDISSLTPEEVQRLVHELRVHQVELEMQNEDLRRAQVKLEELKDRYLDLYDFAPVGYVTLNEKGLILEANLTAVRLLEVERQALIKRPFSRFVCEAFGDAYYLHLQQVFETQSKQTCEIELTKEDGTHFYAQLESEAVQDENGQFSRCRTIVTDISERKDAEETQRESEDRYRDLVENIQDLICTHDLQGKLLFVNQASATIVGYSPADLVGTDMRNFLAPEVRDQFDAYLAAIQRDGQASGLMLVQTKRGEKRIWEYRNTLSTEGHGEPIVRGFAQDITERKNMEENLREAEQRYRRLFEQAPTMYVITRDEQGVPFISDCNDLFLTSLGHTREEVQGKPLADFYSPESRAELLEHGGYPRALAGEFFIGERQLVRSDGSLVPTLLYTATEMDPSGRVTGTRAMFVDITERKSAEEALRDSESRLSSYLSSINEMALGVFVVDRNYKVRHMNPTMVRWFGDHSGKVCYESVAGLSAPCPYCQLSDVINDSKVVHYEPTTPDGKTFRIVAAPVRENDGSISKMEIIADITDRKRTEDALRDSEERFRFAMEATNDGVWDWDLKTDQVFRSPGFFSMLGYGDEEFSGRFGEWQNLVHPQDLKAVIQTLNEYLDGTKENFETEFRMINKSGDAVWILSRGKVVARDENGEPLRMVGTHTNITEGKKLEEALRESEERYRGIFDNAAVGIDVVDAVGKIRQVNHSFSQMLGYSVDELLKMTILDITHPEDVEDSKYRHQKMVEGKTDAYRFEKRYVRKDGEVFWADVSVSPVIGPEGVYEATIGVISDITARKLAEESLFAARRDWEDTFNSINDLVTIHDKDYNIIHYNTAAKRLLGLPNLVTSDIIKCYECYHGKDCPPEACPSCRCLQTRRQEVFEFFEPHLDMFVEVRAIPRFTADGELSGLVHVVRDITERKVSEALLHTRLNLLEYSSTHSLDELLQKTLDEVGSLTSSPIGFYDFISEDEKTVFLHGWSTRTVKEFCQAGPKGQHYPIDQAGVWVDAVRERRPVIHNDYSSLPHRRGLPEGHAPVVRELVVPIMRADRIVAILGIGNKPTDYTEKDVEIVSYLADVAWDIVDHKRTEEALKDSDKQYRTLFENSIDGVYSVLRDGTIMDANPAFCELFGSTREEMVGKDIRELYLDPADRPRFQEEIEKSGFVKDYEIKFQNKKGKEVDCLVTSSVVFDQDGSITGYSGIVRDLTARKELHRQLQQAQKMEAVGTLAGGIAHDFNNLLQVVLGYSELVLADEDLPNRLKNDLGKVLLSARNGADLVQRLLTFSRKTDIKPLDLDLNQRIRQTQKFLERTLPKMIDIELILTDDLARIHADPTQVDQVLMNLAVNARDAMPDGGRLVIETANVFLDEESGKALLGVQPGEYVLLSVSDNGQGMDKETLGHIFEPFYTTKEAGKGTGLGLAMVYGIVHQHDGYITCYSEPGEGTTFKIYFPAVEMEMNLDIATTGIMPAFGTETILLVDDEEFVRDLGKRILERSGYTVLTAANGKEALDSYKREKEKISLVILDLIMPEMGGKQCLEELLRIDPKARVLIASGYSEEGRTKDALQGGAKGFVSKPFDMRRLLQTVRKVLDET